MSQPPCPTVPSEQEVAHLLGRPLPAIRLPSTLGHEADLGALALGPIVLYLYPGADILLGPSPGRRQSRRSGGPRASTEVGDPGDRHECILQARAFRDYALDFAALRVKIVGVSVAPIEHQRDLALREGIPFPLLSDSSLQLLVSLGLPTCVHAGVRLYRRLTLVAWQGAIKRIFYPVASARSNPAQVLAWLGESAAPWDRPHGLRTDPATPGAG